MLVEGSCIRSHRTHLLPNPPLYWYSIWRRSRLSGNWICLWACPFRLQSTISPPWNRLSSTIKISFLVLPLRDSLWLIPPTVPFTRKQQSLLRFMLLHYVRPHTCVLEFPFSLLRRSFIRWSRSALVSVSGILHLPLPPSRCVNCKPNLDGLSLALQTRLQF